MNFKKRAAVYLFLGLFAMTLFYFVNASYGVSTSTGLNIFTVDEDVSNLYNITINNSEADAISNITEINVTFPAGTFLLSTNGSSVSSTFSNISTRFNWNNSEGLIMNLSNQSFWINATFATPGTYNISINVNNASGFTHYNITLLVSDTLGPIINNVTNYSITKMSVTLNWTTNVASNSTISYRLQNGTNLTIVNTSVIVNHSITIVNLTSATRYSYSILSCDSDNNCNTSQNYTFTTESFASNHTFLNHTDGVSNLYNVTINNSETATYANITEINITLPLGLNYTANTNTTSAQNYTFLNTSSSNRATLSWRNESGLVMNNVLSYFTFNARPDENMNGYYNLTVVITNAFGISNTNISVRVHDDTVPVINTTSLAAESIDTDSADIVWITNEASNSTVYYSDTDTTPDNGDSIDGDSSLVTSHEVTLTGLDADTEYNYEVFSCDANGNCASLTSEDESFTTDADDGDTSSGGGGGDTGSGFWTSTESYSDKEMSARGNLNISLLNKERARIKIDGDRYYIGIVKLSSSSVTINVSDADDIWLQDKFSKGDSKKYEVTGDNYYDLEVTLKEIKSSAANITVKYLHELRTTNLANPTFNSTESELNVTQNETDNGGFFGTSDLASEPGKVVLFILIAIAVLLLIGLIINKIGKIKSGKTLNEEQSMITKVKQEIKNKTAKHFAKGKVNVKHP